MKRIYTVSRLEALQGWIHMKITPKVTDEERVAAENLDFTPKPENDEEKMIEKLTRGFKKYMPKGNQFIAMKIGPDGNYMIPVELPPLEVAMSMEEYETAGSPRLMSTVKVTLDFNEEVNPDA